MYQYKYFVTNMLPYEDIKTELEIASTKGIPCGTISRRILLYLTSQIYLLSQKKKQKIDSKKIFLGKSFSDFNGYLELDDTFYNHFLKIKIM